MQTEAVSLLALHAAALQSEGGSPERAALAAALAAAPWGGQPDGSFLTRRAGGFAAQDYYATLHARGRGGPLAEVHHGRSRRGPRDICELTQIRSRAEARQIREAERTRAREGQALYHSERAAVVAALLRGESLSWEPGQNGGILRTEDGSRPVSARGALRGCGLGREEADALTTLPERPWTISLGQPLPVEGISPEGEIVGRGECSRTWLAALLGELAGAGSGALIVCGVAYPASKWREIPARWGV